MPNPDPAFSKVLYVVPLNDTAGDPNDVPGAAEATAAIQEGVLDGTTAISSTTTAAQGVSANSQFFQPVTNPNTPAQGIDYGTDAQNQAGNRAQCETLSPPRPDGTDIAYAVYGVRAG
jgi:hypothetical protein